MQFLNIYIDKTSAVPMYQQLYKHLAEEIRAGKITAGEKMPGKRSAAAQLAVSVNTVNEAYQMLVAEGYLAAIPRSGFVVNRLQKIQKMQESNKVSTVEPSLQPQNWRYSFSTGGGDSSLFPASTWKRIFRRVLAENDDWYEYGHPQGDYILRLAIANYLRTYRGVNCAPQQLVVGAGLEVLLSLLTPLLSKKIAVENPCYTKARSIMQLGGADIFPIDLDRHGMPPQDLANSNAGAVYLTPNHQFPTGVSMPVGRRTEILHWASNNGAIILEDDYDSELRFGGRPLPCMQGLDKNGCVAYIGTFSRLLAPGLRVAYIVLPQNILERWQQTYSGYICTVSRLEQQTLAHFIADGYFTRNLAKIRSEYKQRREILLKSLSEKLPPKKFKLDNTDSGLFFSLHPLQANAAALAQKAQNNGIYIRACSTYSMQENAAYPGGDALLLGYGSISQKNIPDAVKELVQSI